MVAHGLVKCKLTPNIDPSCPTNMAQHMKRPQSPGLMEDLRDLDEHDLPDLVAIFEEHFGSPSQEQQQDLRDFATGALDFEALYSKYWNEDGSWKEDVNNLQEYLEALLLDTKTEPKSQKLPVIDESEDLEMAETPPSSCASSDEMDVDD